MVGPAGFDRPAAHHSLHQPPLHRAPVGHRCRLFRHPAVKGPEFGAHRPHPGADRPGDLCLRAHPAAAPGGHHAGEGGEVEAGRRRTDETAGGLGAEGAPRTANRRRGGKEAPVANGTDPQPPATRRPSPSVPGPSRRPRPPPTSAASGGDARRVKANRDRREAGRTAEKPAARLGAGPANGRSVRRRGPAAPPPRWPRRSPSNRSASSSRRASWRRNSPGGHALLEEGGRPLDKGAEHLAEPGRRRAAPAG